MSDINTTSTLYIPDNIKTNYEFMPGFGAFGVFKKDNYNQSMLDHARRFFLFSKEQQKYKYQYYNPFAPKD